VFDITTRRLAVPTVHGRPHLCALSLTLQLQTKELTDTRRALAEQAETASKQFALTLEIEQRRLSPLLKVQWVREAEPKTVRKKPPGTDSAVSPCAVKANKYWTCS